MELTKPYFDGGVTKLTPDELHDIAKKGGVVAHYNPLDVIPVTRNAGDYYTKVVNPLRPCEPCRLVLIGVTALGKRNVEKGKRHLLNERGIPKEFHDSASKVAGGLDPGVVELAMKIVAAAKAIKVANVITPTSKRKDIQTALGIDATDVSDDRFSAACHIAVEVMSK